MAQKVQVLLTCDLHGDDTAGQETIAFSLDGAAYEIDVCGKHAAQFRDAMAGYVGVARRAGGRAGGRRGRGRSGGRQEMSDVRDWARQQGLQISDRGRIPSSVTDQYRAAH